MDFSMGVMDMQPAEMHGRLGGLHRQERTGSASHNVDDNEGWFSQFGRKEGAPFG